MELLRDEVLALVRPGSSPAAGLDAIDPTDAKET